MLKFDLNSKWRMTGNGFDIEGTIPGSVYSFLLENELVEDPFYRENELDFLELAEHEYTFTTEFEAPAHNAAGGDKVLLHCDGLDTICELYLNGQQFGYTDNMHRTYEFDITKLLADGTNTLAAKFLPINPYMKKLHAENPVSFSMDPLLGFSQTRKAYCMMGWDWGPRLPDAGIWRDIYLVVENSARIDEVRILQKHEDGRVWVEPKVAVKNCVKNDDAKNAANNNSNAKVEVQIKVTAPDGCTFEMAADKENEIENPMLWMPNGLGEQHLYTVTVNLLQNGEVVDTCEKCIGLRSLKLVRERDVYGEGFYHEINGVSFFVMGGDYIPEDNIFSRITPERTRKLLTQCRDCNFNAVRVWGGGYYPHDWFFDICDELGLIVFQDMMFACSFVPDTKEFLDNIAIEIEENLKRIRHHASLVIISGNNEVECCIPESEAVKQNYYHIFEGMIPDIVKKVCPEIPYVSSSPSTVGHFVDPNNENYGDSHYWDVWHGGKPFTEYRNHYFRYLSEFGFQSFPCEKTVEQFTLPEDRNIFSRVFERHQRHGDANKKILMYLADTFKYPTNFGTLLYASQLLQAEAIRYGVEHLRRHRGRCMGTMYWQINDIWPVASWASIDYYGRFKALQYVAKRFYNPVMISCMEIGEKTTRPVLIVEPAWADYETKATLCVTNDTYEAVTGVVRWALRKADSTIIEQGEQELTVEACTAKWLDEMDFHKTDVENNYMSFEYEVDGEVVSSGAVLFTAPKHFKFADPNLRYEVKREGAGYGAGVGDGAGAAAGVETGAGTCDRAADGAGAETGVGTCDRAADGASAEVGRVTEITVHADAYARYVEIYSPDSDFILSDNYFDMNAGSKTVKVLEGDVKTIVLRSVYDIK